MNIGVVDAGMSIVGGGIAVLGALFLLRDKVATKEDVKELIDRNCIECRKLIALKSDLSWEVQRQMRETAFVTKAEFEARIQNFDAFRDEKLKAVASDLKAHIAEMMDVYVEKVVDRFREMGIIRRHE